MITNCLRAGSAAALAIAIAIAPVHGQAAETSASPVQSCRGGEELFRGLFYGEGSSAGLIAQIADADALKAAQEKKSRLTVQQTINLLKAQRAKLVEAGRTADAELVDIGIAGLSKRDRPTALVMDQTDARPADSSSRIVAMINKRDPGFFSTLATDLQSGDPVKVDRALRKAWKRNVAMIELLGGGGSAADGDSGHGVDQDSSVVLWLGIALILFVWIALPITNESFTGLAHDESVARLTSRLACPAK